MSRLTLSLKTQPAERIDLSGLLPAMRSGQTVTELSRLPVGGTSSVPVRLGDMFTLSGTAGDEIVIDGATARMDGVGARLVSGTLAVTGDVGAKAGLGMAGGKLSISGNAGAYLGTGMKGGVIHVMGSAGDFVGGVSAGKRFGMTGGSIIIDGSAGSRAGDRMRRGLICVRGKTGDAAGSRMIGGTIVAEGGFGPRAGDLMRRGSLIGPKFDTMLATFADCGVHDLVILRVMSRAWLRDLGPLAPRPLPHRIRRFAGDLATIGKGELLMTSA